MTGISNWYIKPDRKADAHPLETYDEKSDRYIYDRRKKLKPVVEIESDVAPEATEEYAEMLLGVLRGKYPGLTPTESDVPIAIQLSVYPKKISPESNEPYAVGYSPLTWETWLYGAFRGVIWRSDEQICVTGTEFRQRDHLGIRISVYNIWEQLKK